MFINFQQIYEPDHILNPWKNTWENPNRGIKFNLKKIYLLVLKKTVQTKLLKRKSDEKKKL